MVKLKIKNIDDGLLTLVDDSNFELNIDIEFRDIQEQPKIGDYIYISAQLLNPQYPGYSTFYAFGSLDNKYGKEIDVNMEKDIIIYETADKRIFLKRLYG